MTNPIRYELVITGSGEVRDSDGNLLNQQEEPEEKDSKK